MIGDRNMNRGVGLKAIKPGHLPEASRNTLTDKWLRNYSEGRTCNKCGGTEAGCAKTYPCCYECGHTFGEGNTTVDAESIPAESSEWKVQQCPCGWGGAYKTNRRKYCPLCNFTLPEATSSYNQGESEHEKAS